jgi:hypothetical protein
MFSYSWFSPSGQKCDQLSLFPFFTSLWPLHLHMLSFQFPGKWSWPPFLWSVVVENWPLPSSGLAATFSAFLVVACELWSHGRSPVILGGKKHDQDFFAQSNDCHHRQKRLLVFHFSLCGTWLSLPWGVNHFSMEMKTRLVVEDRGLWPDFPSSKLHAPDNYPFC